MDTSERLAVIARRFDGNEPLLAEQWKGTRPFARSDRRRAKVRRTGAVGGGPVDALPTHPPKLIQTSAGRNHDGAQTMRSYNGPCRKAS